MRRVRTAVELQARDLCGPVMKEPVRLRHGWAGERGQSRLGWAQLLESSHRQFLTAPGTPFRDSGYRAQAGPERGSPSWGPGVGTCWAPRSGSPPPSRASPWRNSCTSTRPSLLLSSSSKRRPHRCRRSASPGPPRMAPVRGEGEAQQQRPQRGLCGSPSPPGSRRSATATAASALPD